MDITFFHDLPGYLLQMYTWATKQNGVAAFGVGVFTWFFLERVLGFVTNPIGKVLSFLGVAFVICFAVAVMTDFATSYQRGSPPFLTDHQDSNAQTLRELDE